MGLGEFFRNLFGGGNSPKLDPAAVSINITDKQIMVNGTPVDVPCHLDVLKKLLGSPRKTVGKNRENINFTWDDLGIYCYTKGNNVVYCIGVKVKFGSIKPNTDPRSTFRGTLTIGSEQWEEVMHGGVDMDGFFRQRDYPGLSLVSEYADMEVCDKNGCHGAYSGVEIQLPDSYS